ncbi:MAG: PilN domain-containing protein [Acidobacteriota bacterium]|nr:PilN domain-containing protein [Acidobacteriota bacterium]
MIKINLVREGRAVRGAGAAPGAAAAAMATAGPSNLNTMLIVAGVAIGVVIGGGWWVIEKNKLSGKRDEVASKTREAQRLESIIKEVEEYQRRKDNLQKRIDLINQLKQNQKGPVKIMDRVSQDLPDLVWLDKMTMSGGLITITGRGLNPNAIANFVEAIKKDPLFEEPDLSSMNQVTVTPPVYAFDMTFHFTYAPKGEAGAPGAATGTGTGTTGTTTTTGSATKR